MNHSVCALQEIKKQLEEEEYLEPNVYTHSKSFSPSKNKMGTDEDEEEEIKPFREKVSIKV
jgi:hypothetical protein